MHYHRQSIKLKSGLMEITYDTGAKLILQGPVTYQVDSADGGYLAVGKLTAKLDAHARAAKDNEEAKSRSASIARCSRPSVFSVRTPNAVVTDLGTEFGVEVDERGGTRSRVFQGLVRMQGRDIAGTTLGPSQLLHKNESAFISAGSNCVTMVDSSAKSTQFIRTMPPRRIKTLDLVDVVAGGDGFSGGRNRGINPMNGRATALAPAADGFFLRSDGKCHRVDGLPLVEGVFIPMGGTQSEQIDSLGHTLGDWLPPTNHQTYGYIWAGGTIPSEPTDHLQTTLNGVDYAAAGHGLIFLHANSGITFDLAAVRRANPGFAVVRFTGTTGNTNAGNTNADCTVLVDGRVRFRRREINGFSGPSAVAIPIAPADRFLTLIRTCNDVKLDSNWIIFGDPHLELQTSERSP